IPRHPGYTSALGILLTSPRRDFVKTRPVLAEAADGTLLRSVFDALEKEAVAYFGKSLGIAADKLDFEYMVDARYAAQHSCLTLFTDRLETSAQVLAERFADEHENAFSFQLSEHPIEFVTYRLTATARSGLSFQYPAPPPGKTTEKAHSHDRTVDFI